MHKFIFIFFLCLCTSLLTLNVKNIYGEESELSNNDAKVLLDMLLDLSPKDRSVNEEIKRQKNFMAIYTKYHEKKELNENEMKIYLFEGSGSLSQNPLFDIPS